MSALLPFVADVAALPAPPRVETSASSSDVARFGAALEQALLAASMAEVPRPPQAMSSLVDLAAALAEFAGASPTEEGATDATVTEPVDEALVQQDTAADGTLRPALFAGATDVESHGELARPAVVRAEYPVALPSNTPETTPETHAAPLAPTHSAAPQPEMLQAELTTASRRQAKTPVEVTAHEEASASVAPSRDSSEVEKPIAATPSPRTGSTESQGPADSHTGNAAVDAMMAAMLSQPQRTVQVVKPVPLASPKTTADGASAEATPRSGHALEQTRAAEGTMLPSPAPQRHAAPAVTAPIEPATTSTKADAAGERAAEAVPSRTEAPMIGDATTTETAERAPVTSLPAGVRVLELHAQHARRASIIGAPARAARSDAPRTAQAAAGELQAATVMPSIAADAIEQLRRPVPREGGFALPAAPVEADIGRVEASAAADEGANDAMLDDRPSTAQPAAVLAASAASDGFASALGASRGQDAPRTVAASAGQSATVADLAPSAQPESPVAPKPGTERISVRLGDDVGAPVVRISIRGDAVDARIITPDSGLARELGSHTRELAAALEGRGFESAKVQVRGTGSAHEGLGAAQVAGSSVAEARDAQHSRNDDQRRPQDERAQTQRDERSDARQQQKKTPRRFRLDDDETP